MRSSYLTSPCLALVLSVGVSAHFYAHAQSKEEACDAHTFQIDDFSEKALNNQKLSICLKQSDGTYLVDKEALAERLIQLAYLPLHIKRRVVIVDKNLSAAQNYMINYRVFGNVSLYTAEEKCHYSKSIKIKEYLSTYFRTYLNTDKGFKLGINKGQDAEATRDGLTAVTFFKHKSPFNLYCTINQETPREISEKSHNILSKGKVRIGANSDDLFKDLAESKSFSLDVKDDRVKEQASVGVDGVAGLVFGDEQLGIALYSKIKYYDQDPDSNSKPDISYIAPGIALRHQSASANFAHEVQFDTNPIFDEKNGTILYSARAFYSPSIQLPNGKMLFDDPFQVIGPVRLTPDAGITTSYTFIEESGRNSQFAGIQDYFGWGFDTSLEFFLVDVPKYLEDFSLIVTYSERYFTAEIENIQRFGVTLAYYPDKKNFSVKADYIWGSDLLTLQDEDRFSFGLGFRY